MINLAGQDLILDNPNREIEDFIYRWINPASFCPWLTPVWPGFGLTGITFPIGKYHYPKFKLNKFYWFADAQRFAYGHFVASSSQVEQIVAAAYTTAGAYNPVPFMFGGSSTQGDGSSYGETVSVNVFVLPPTPLSGIRAPDNADSLYLLSLVDQRYFWWYNNVGDMKVLPNTQWTELYNKVGEAIDVTIDIDPIDPAYLQPSTMFNLPYEPVPVIMDAIASNLNQRIVCTYDGKVKSMNYTNSLKVMQKDMSDNPKRVIIAGGQRFNNPL